MHVMEQVVTHHRVRCFRTQGIYLSADMPFSNINTIGQRGMPKDGLLSDNEHRIEDTERRKAASIPLSVPRTQSPEGSANHLNQRSRP
jgi:hypothetical protein